VKMAKKIVPANLGSSKNRSKSNNPNGTINCIDYCGDGVSLAEEVQ